jgi:hypothetical protein
MSDSQRRHRLGAIRAIGSRGWMVAVLATITAGPVLAGGSGTWSGTGSMTTARTNQTATLLNQGQVLVAGGYSGGNGGHYIASAELYNSSTGQWTATGNMSHGRSAHTATRLPNGQVLVAGGNGNNNTTLASAELYTP